MRGARRREKMREVECDENVEGRKILKCNTRRVIRKDKWWMVDGGLRGE